MDLIRSLLSIGCTCVCILLVWKSRLFCVQSSLNFAPMSEKTNHFLSSYRRVHVHVWCMYVSQSGKETLRIKVMCVSECVSRHRLDSRMCPLLKDVQYIEEFGRDCLRFDVKVTGRWWKKDFYFYVRQSNQNPTQKRRYIAIISCGTVSVEFFSLFVSWLF